MSEPSAQWSEAFARASADSMGVYDRVIAPMFRPWGRDLIERVGPRAGGTALDVACGPGTVTYLLAEAVGPSGRVVATDISPAMLDIARSNAAAGSAIEWVESPAAPLTVPDAAFDTIVCQQGLQFFPDKVAALAEMRRAMRDGGTAGVAVWTAVGDQIFHVLHDAAAAVLGDEIAHAYTGPFTLSGQDAADAARDAGFHDVALERVTMPVVVEGGFDAMFDTLAASGIAGIVASLDPARLAAFREDAQRRALPYQRGESLAGTMTSSILILR